MLTEWLWNYEYLVNLRKLTLSVQIFSQKYLIYGNIMLFGHYWQFDFYHDILFLPPPLCK